MNHELISKADVEQIIANECDKWQFYHGYEVDACDNILAAVRKLTVFAELQNLTNYDEPSAIIFDTTGVQP